MEQKNRVNIAVENILEAGLGERKLERAVQAANDKKAVQIVVLDLKGIATFTDYFVICSGKSARQVQAISDEIEEQLLGLAIKPIHIEGYQKAEWVLMDYGDFIVHIFVENARLFYDLERLWHDAGRIEVKDE